MAHFLGVILAFLPIYLWRFSIGGLPTTALEILIVVFLLSTIKLFDWHKIKSLGKINYWIGLFVLAGIISTLVSPEPIKALGQLKAFVIEPVLLFYASILVLNKGNIKTVLKWLFISAVLISLFALIQYLTHILLPLRFWGSGLEPKRVTSFFEYPNALALYLAPLLAFFSVLFMKNQKYIHMYILFPGLVVMAGALILTMSRGAWVAAAIALLILALKNYPVKKVAWTVVILLLLLAFSPLRYRLQLNDISSAAHGQLWSEAIGQIGRNPILGNGLHGFQAYNVLYPHNIILNFWLEMGLLGLISFAAVIYLCLRQYQKKPSGLKLAGLMFLLVLLIHGLVDVPYFKNDLSVLFWFITSLFYIQE